MSLMTFTCVLSAEYVLGPSYQKDMYAESWISRFACTEGTIHLHTLSCSIQPSNKPFSRIILSLNCDASEKQGLWNSPTCF